jgi:hypothetical protein
MFCAGANTIGSAGAHFVLSPQPMIPQSLIPSSQTIGLDALGSQNAGGHSGSITVIANDQDMLATELAQSLLCLEQGLKFQPLGFQHAGVCEWLWSV